MYWPVFMITNCIQYYSLLINNFFVDVDVEEVLLRLRARLSAFADEGRISLTQNPCLFTQ